MFKVPALNKKKKEADSTKKWKRFSVSLNRANQVAIRCMLSHWAHVKGSSLAQRERLRRNIRNLSLAYPSLEMKLLVRGIFRTLPNI